MKDVVGELKEIQEKLEQNVINISSLDLDLEDGDQAMFDESVDEIDEVIQDIDQLIRHLIRGGNLGR